MTNEEVFNFVRGLVAEEAERDLETVRSWKAVGKNYATRKDGKPYANPVKAFYGVDGIWRADHINTFDGSITDIVNNAGYGVPVFRGDKVADIENRIAQTIKEAEESYRMGQLLLSEETAEGLFKKLVKLEKEGKYNRLKYITHTRDFAKFAVAA